MGIKPGDSGVGLTYRCTGSAGLHAGRLPNEDRRDSSYECVPRVRPTFHVHGEGLLVTPGPGHVLPSRLVRDESYPTTISGRRESRRGIRIRGRDWNRFNSRLAPLARPGIRRGPASNAELTNVPCSEITRSSTDPASFADFQTAFLPGSYSAKVSGNSRNGWGTL